jgi:metal-responsive CopG/Arc/MetJ family transcriptional regulator
VRTTIYLPKQLHRQLKAAALDEEQEMSEIIEELINQWLESRNSDV